MPRATRIRGNQDEGDDGGGGGGLKKKGKQSQVPPAPPPQKKRGRPPKVEESCDDGVGQMREMVSKTVMKGIEKNLEAYENDFEIVTCSECGPDFGEMTRFHFRLHNIRFHMNTAATTDEKDDLVMDHKYFSRKLNEFKKLTKATAFQCTRKGCTSSFKSTLGLAYHMNTCGRSAEELDAVLIECDICHHKCSLPNMQWHKKIHEEGRSPSILPDHQSNRFTASRKRLAALNARKSLKNSENETNNDNEGTGSTRDDREPSERKSVSSKTVNKVPRDNVDFCNLATDFLENLDSEEKAWDNPVRRDVDSLLHMRDNQFMEISNQDFDPYLPDHKESVSFKHKDKDNTSVYHRLPWFEGETLADSTSLYQSGGPVLSISWHPSGKLLAVSVGKNWKEEIDSLKVQERKSCLQIYSVYNTNMYLQLLCGIRWGYANHIQWSSYFPDIMDSFDPSQNSCFDDVEVYCRIGYLAMTCEDSTVRVMAIRIEDLKMAPNFEYKNGHMTRLYTKTPEICLKVHDSIIDEDIGNVIKFDWHEGQKFLAAGYANGLIAVYDVETKSALLTETITESNDTITIINPVWVFQGHRLAITGICFDPNNPRYLATAGQDRTIKVWDTETRLLRDMRRSGICMDMCWIRGWIHQVVCFESHVAYQSSMHNYARVFQTGSLISRPTTAELLNFTTLDFFHGLTLQGTDDGKVNVTYYDWFWRECDYDRNRKKKNLVILSTTEIDPNSYEKLSSSDFDVSVKKLKKSIYSSKAYQRLGINEDEGVYSGMLEAKFGGPDIFEPINDSEDAVEESTEEDDIETQDTGYITEKDSETDKDLDIAEAVNSALSVFHKEKNDGLIPTYDVNFREEEPKIMFSFKNQRPNTGIPLSGFSDTKLEEYVRFQPFFRINKVKWSPNGHVIAVGYQNGLVALLPGAFEDIFTNSSPKKIS